MNDWTNANWMWGKESFGETLYIGASSALVLKEPSPTSPAVARVELGDAVTWLGKDPTDRLWHRIRLGFEHNYETGVIYHSNLTRTRPDGKLHAAPSEICRFCAGTCFVYEGTEEVH